MKQPKKPTYQQKKRMSEKGMDWKEWMVAADDPLTLIHKQTKEKKVLD